MPELILKLGLPRMQNHKVKVGFFWLLKRLNYFFGQLQLYDSGVAFWTMHQGKHGHCDSATKDWALNHRMRSRPDSGHGAYAVPIGVSFWGGPLLGVQKVKVFTAPKMPAVTLLPKLTQL